MKKFMDFLHDKCEKFLNTKWIIMVMNFIMITNPLSLTPQVIKVFTEDDVSAISPTMWYLFVAVQFSYAFQGIKQRNSIMFFSMVMSLIQSMTVIITIWIKS